MELAQDPAVSEMPLNQVILSPTFVLGPGLSNSQENRNILDQTSRSLPHMAQGPDFSNRFPTTATAPQETFFQHTKSYVFGPNTLVLY